MFRSIVLCAAVLLHPQTTGESEEAKSSRKAIEGVLTSQVDAWDKGDLVAFMAGYARSNDLTFYSGDTILKGWDATLERYQKKYQGQGNEMGKLTFRDLDIQLLSADSAVVRGRWELKRTNDSPHGLFTLIVRKTAEGWRIVHDHTSN
jgi:beta-aspartyl-peptidase (threonine type)